MNMDHDPDIITSGLSGPFTRDGETVEVQIYRIETAPQWVLEVINKNGTSIVWEDHFETAEDAKAAFDATIDSEGIGAFLDTTNIVPFPTRH